jgi:hypothetical protein
LVASGMDVYFVWFCVFSFFKASRDIFVLVCVSLDLFRYCLVIMRDFLADSLCAIFVYLRFRCVIPLGQVLVWDTQTIYQEITHYDHTIPKQIQ